MARAKKDIKPVNDAMELCESDDDSDSVPEANISKRFPTLASGEVNATIDKIRIIYRVSEKPVKARRVERSTFLFPRLFVALGRGRVLNFPKKSSK